MFSFLRTPTTWHYPHSPAARRAAVRLYSNQSISLACSSGFAAVGSCCDRRANRQTKNGQTDRRTPDRCIDPAPHSLRSVSIRKQLHTYDAAECAMFCTPATTQCNQKSYISRTNNATLLHIRVTCTTILHGPVLVTPRTHTYTVMRYSA